MISGRYPNEAEQEPKTVNLEARSTVMSGGRAAMSVQPPKLGQQHAAFPLPEGEVTFSYPAQLSTTSAEVLGQFVSLIVTQAKQMAKTQEDTAKAQRHLDGDPD